MSSACQAFPVGGKPNAIGASAAAATSSLGGDQGTVFGGAIIGVASKVNRPSLKIFNCADHYNGWEFIWNPAAQQMTGGPQPGAQPPANPAINNPRLQFMSPNPNPQPQPPQPQPNPQP